MTSATPRAGHRRPQRHRSAPAIAVLVALLAGCTSAPAEIADAPSATAAPPAGAQPSAETPPVPAAPSEPGARPSTPAGDATDAPTDCGDDLAALDAVITDQLDAFAADDWERAFALTSRQFRSGGLDADGLRQIVTSGYPEAADATDHDVVGCILGGREAQVLIEITASEGGTLDLVYLLTREGGDWRISGAVEHGTVQSEPPTTTA